jgi:hypothetical protein
MSRPSSRISPRLNGHSNVATTVTVDLVVRITFAMSSADDTLPVTLLPVVHTAKMLRGQMTCGLYFLNHFFCYEEGTFVL